jgi:uncharacterized repeat protein (TIGR03806 family)
MMSAVPILQTRHLKKTTTIAGLLVSLVAAVACMQSCNANRLLSTGNNAKLFPLISDYHIFKGSPSQLIPGKGFEHYELATALFTDYAEKQRLIKIPAGHKMTAINDSLPDFPDGTILVKTFYYFKDKRDTGKGKQLLETRILLKTNGGWSAGTYVWNTAQTEASLLTNGLNTPVAWVTINGVARTTSYHVPGNKECATCHNANNTIIPIGPTIRNLNMEVTRNKAVVNQLSYFQEAGILNPVNPASFSTLPDWQNTSNTLAERARAYLDVNCAHCHNPKGSCAKSDLRFAYEMPLQHTQIDKKRSRINKLLTKGTMPMLGTTIIDEEAVALVKSYLKTLQ